jgi:ribosome-associated heat shock protein Hsp15
MTGGDTWRPAPDPTPDPAPDPTPGPDQAPAAVAGPVANAAEGSQRLDIWLHHARFFKTRSLAAKIVKGGGVRVDGTVMAKAHWQVRPGQVLTFVQGTHVRVVRVVALPARRGPAPEAALSYDDLSPPSPDNALPRSDAGPGGRASGAGRPTKRDRRRVDAFTGRDG